jgi:hypothetical protein
LSIIAGQPHHLAIEVRNLLPDSLACLKQGLYGGSEFWPSLGHDLCVLGRVAVALAPRGPGLDQCAKLGQLSARSSLSSDFRLTAHRAAASVEAW